VPDTDYTVRLPAFEGPLDLLLHLIERRELDITAISLGTVTDQYLEYVELLEEVEPSTLADFLTVAAQLMLIKSRLLLPQPEPEDVPEEEDPAEALARRLEEYRQFKQVAAGLRDRETKGLRAYKRGGPLPDFPTRPLLEGIAPADLAQTLQALLSQRPKVASVNRVIRPLRVTIAEKIELLGKDSGETKTRTLSPAPAPYLNATGGHSHVPGHAGDDQTAASRCASRPSIRRNHARAGPRPAFDAC